MANIIVNGKFKGRDSNGNPLAGGKLYTYEAGSAGGTPKATYTDSNLTTANANPVVLDADGRASVWIGTGSYQLVLKDANDVTIWSVDDYQEVLSSQSYASTVEVQLGSAGATSNTVFTLTNPYATASDNIHVFVQGVRQIEGTDYYETDANTITFTSSLLDTDVVQFVVGALASTVAFSSLSSANVTYLPAGTGASLTDVQTKLRETVSVADFGAKGNTTTGLDGTDDYSAINNAITSGAKVIQFEQGKSYRIDTRITLLAATSDLIIDLNGSTVYVNTPTNAFYIPAVGDGDAGVAGATNITIKNGILDGTNDAGSSGIGILSYNADGLNVLNVESNNWSLSGCVIYGLSSGSNQVYVNNYKGTGNTNHAIAVSTQEEDASRVVLDGIYANTNGLGIDISAGSATVSNVYCWNNTNGGMKTAGNDNQHLILSNADLSNNTAGSAQGFYTNGSFKLLEFSNVRCNNNGSTGVAINHDGTVLISNLDCSGNGGQGLYMFAGTGASGATYVNAGNITAYNNTGRGVLVSNGSLQCSNLRTSGNTNRGCQVTTYGDVYINTYHSINDCGSALNALDINPTAITFVDGDVTVGTDTINATSHGLLEGQVIRLTSTGTLPAGLNAEYAYFVKRTDADNFQLSTSSGGSAIDITAAAGGGTHSVQSGAYNVTNMFCMDNRTPHNVVNAISLNSTVTRAFIGNVRVVSSDNTVGTISDSGTNTTYLDREGWSKIARDRISFYDENTPRVKQTVSGSTGGNAALQSLLTALQTIGLITDSSTEL